MQAVREFFIQTFGIEAWLAMVLAIVVLAFVITQVARLVFNQFEKLAKRTHTHWDEALIQAARKPVHLIIGIVALAWIARVLQAHWPELDMAEEVFQARNVAVVLAVAWFFWHFFQQLTLSTIERGREAGQEFDVTTVYALSKLGRLVVVIVSAITVAHNLGLNVGALLALGGVGGLAVGLAAKDLLANFFGGLTIYLDRPFSVGDWIRSPDKSIEGTVEYISWRHTRVRAFNKNPIYVPNAVFTTIVVENPSRMTHRRLKETVGIRYDDFAQVEAIVTDIRTMLEQHKDIDNTQTLIVNFNAFAASSLDIMIYTFTRTRNWVLFHGIKQDVLLTIGRIIEGHGAEIAFPTQTLHLANGGPAEAPDAVSEPEGG
ncbi:mechanosensitive ion channel family protein [Hydrogenophaga sp. PAMC20947]|uniref:mechanosensitive ion channel family protein n=1 Tax=Hydrogenophaga sp. PAMC20947 TaxID=2565558 RepID=UPI00109E021D|nr:mechanosensitive ion channel family protein [Hydrogenophaga sp. PAMC20947]QCB48070.1 mechanosensitive ion channel family protein [Hydrogenophaga sp. PAMC20947]